MAKFEVKYEFDPLKNIRLKEANKDELLTDIADFIKEKMLLDIADQRSPVTGQKWSGLSKEYAKIKGSKSANLELDGDMLDALDVRVEDEKIVVEVLGDEADKAYGHNTGFQGHPWLDGVAPKRQFVPFKDETFRKGILDGIKTIIKDSEGDL